LACIRLDLPAQSDKKAEENQDETSEEILIKTHVVLSRLLWITEAEELLGLGWQLCYRSSITQARPVVLRPTQGLPLPFRIWFSIWRRPLVYRVVLALSI